MPPKPAAKLTKKQLKQLADQQKRKKDQEEEQKRIQDQAKRAEQKRLHQIQLERRAQEEKLTVAQEKQQYRPFLEQRLKQQEKQFNRLAFDQEWNNQTSQYFKSYDVNGVNLSTFINIFRDQAFQNPQKVLKFCEEAEVITQRLAIKQLQARTQNDVLKEMETKNSIIEINKIKLQKLEEIMINMANSAEDMQDKNNEMTKAKNQPNVKKEGQKLLQYQHFLSKNFKIGMFLNSITTKNNNKFRPIQIKQFGLNTQIPSKWINANTIVKFQWTNFNPYSPETNETFNIIGGVYNIEFYQLLLGSKKINNVVLKKYYKGKQILQKFKLATSLIREPFQLQYQIPNHIFLHTFDQFSLKFAQYDVNSNKWTILPTDTVQQYDPKTKKVVCKVSRPQPIAYVQQKCFDYPYVSWQLRTVSQGTVHLDIQLKRQMMIREGTQKNLHFMLKFQLVQDLVKLITNQEYPELEDLCSTLHTPQSLLSELSNRGIHLLPTDLDYIQAQLPAKQKQSQQRAIRQIAYAVESFYVRSQPNNGPSIVVKIRQNLDHESIFLEDQQKDWKIINWHNQRCWVSNKNIYEKHLNLEILLQKHDFCESQCLSRMKYDKQYLLRRSVMKMLSLTRILSFTTSDPQNSKLRDVLKSKILVSK